MLVLKKKTMLTVQLTCTHVAVLHVTCGALHWSGHPAAVHISHFSEKGPYWKQNTALIKQSIKMRNIFGNEMSSWNWKISKSNRMVSVTPNSFPFK